MAELASGRLVSDGGRPRGAGDRAPRRDATTPDSLRRDGAAVVNSTYRGLGIFGRMFEHTLDAARERELAAVFGDAVTHSSVQPARRALPRLPERRRSSSAWFRRQTTMRGFGREGTENAEPPRSGSYRPLDAHARQAALPGPFLPARCWRAPTRISACRSTLARSPLRRRRGGDGECRRRACYSGALRLRRWDGKAGAELRAGRAPCAFAARRRRLRGRRPRCGGRARRGGGGAERARILSPRALSCMGRTATITSGCSCSIQRRSSSRTSSATLAFAEALRRQILKDMTRVGG
jgi:hypothetical protein